MQIHQLFPLAIGHDHIALDTDRREAMVNFIVSSADEKFKKKKTGWTGDTEGEEFLFSNSLFESIATEISLKIKEYLRAFSINIEMLDLYYQRSWATISTHNQSIAVHDHAQSNISFAYYLRKKEGSGGTLFKGGTQNEFAKDIYNPDKYRLGLVSEANALNSKQALIDGPEGTLLIFPSKALHATSLNMTNDYRITLSGDITMMLKESKGFEHIMPNFKHWKLLD